MIQSKRQSLIESSLNTLTGVVIGFTISQLASHLSPWIQANIWRGFVYDLSAGSNAIMTVILTTISVIRGYFWRRHFNKLLSNSKDAVQ